MNRTSSLLSKLVASEVEFFLKHEEFPGWIDLASTSLLESELDSFEVTDKSSLARTFESSQVCALAQRLILSRHPSLFSTLCTLWQAFGSSGATCHSIEEAIEASLERWPCDVTKYTGSGTSLTFSTAHSEFMQKLLRVSEEDSHGVLGNALRASRLVNETLHVGFPLVLRGNSSPNIRDGFWITPKPTWTSKSDSEFETRWNDLWGKTHKLTSGAMPSGVADVSLPDWTKQLGCNVDTFESAGFAVAMQMLAQQAKVNLPFGVGFTGRWEDGQLRGIRDLAVKLKAGREGGVFLMFACADPIESTLNPIEGIQLVLLPEGLTLLEVVQIVNLACAESGLTEYLWRRLQPKSNNARTNTTYSPNLPDALEEHRCPVGFIGRENTLKRLRDAFAKDSATREMVILQAPARSGKTTLLCQLAKERNPFPVWYSFRRGHANHRLLEQLQQSVETQINARFVAVRSIESKCSLGNSIHSNCRVDIIVDGLDEADTQEHTKIIEWLQGLSINGSTVVGSQPISASDTVDLQKIELRNESPSGESDARELIAKFAERFATKEHLESISSQLQQSEWVEGLVEKSGANLWVLTEFLSGIERDPDGAGWPNDPHQLPLSKDVQTYCQILVAIALSGYGEQEKPDVEKLLATVSFLDHRPWSVFDVLKLAKIDSGANWGRWGLHGVLAKNSRRLLDFNGQECRFFSPLTREAVRRCYTGYNVGFAEVWIELIRSQNEPNRDALLDNLVGAITSLLEDIGESGRTRDAKNLVEALLFKSPWLYLRLRMLIEDKMRLDILHSELSSLRRFIPTDQSDSINRFIDWLISWGWAIEDSGELLDEWWLLAGDVTRSFLTTGLAAVPTNQYRLLAPIIGPTVSHQRYEPMDEVASTDKQYSWLQGQRWDGEVIVQVDHNHHEVLERPFEHEYTSVPRLDVDFLAIASDGTEIGWNRTETKLSIRNTPSCVVEIFLDQLLEALGLHLKQIEFVREVLPSMELEICFAEPETEKLSLVRFTRTGTTLTLSRLVRQVAREVLVSSGDAVIVQDEFSSPKILFLLNEQASQAHTLSEVAPDSHKSDSIRLLVNDWYIRAVRPKFFSAETDCYDKFMANDFSYLYSLKFPEKLFEIGFGISRSLRIISRQPMNGIAIVADIIYSRRRNECSFRLFEFRISQESRLEVSNSKNTSLRRKDPVCCWDWMDDYFAVLYSSGRLEIRLLSSPETILRIGYVSMDNSTISDLLFVRRANELFVVVLASQSCWFPVPQPRAQR